MDCSGLLIGDIVLMEDNQAARVSYVNSDPFYVNIRVPIEAEYYEYKYDVNGLPMDDSPLGAIVEKLAN